MNRIGKQTIVLKNLPKIIQTASVVGQKEQDGKLGGTFDYVIDDGRFGEKSWEKAESKMQKKAVEILLKKADKKNEEIDFIAGGDLLNQCMGTSFGLADFNIPFFGLYGACSTMAESLCIAAMTVDGGYSKNTIAVTSSHFCSSERQFRFPLEYGGQRTPTSQWTVTGSGAALVSDEDGQIAITHITPGKIVDMGIKDANNMGAAMAPAAIDTISTHFKDRNIDKDYYDLVVTGDLGKLGHAITKEQLAKEGLDFKNKYIDCGMEIFDLESQDVHAGGSGCGCCASVFAGHIYSLLKKGEINRVLITATGALMSTTSSFQGESIPGIAHAVAIERV
ncbi:MAG: stage V sporulation protein AD [Clostridia bacterium]|nr:stage V sporulation protein AD [Clostridia bacterium]